MVSSLHQLFYRTRLILQVQSDELTFVLFRRRRTVDTLYFRMGQNSVVYFTPKDVFMGGEIIIYWLTGLVTHTECLENIWIEKGVFRLVASVGQRKSPYEFFYKVHMTSVWGSIPHGDSEFFPCPTLVTRCKNIFLYFFTKLNTYHFSYFIYKHGSIDIADPSSIQDACHNVVIDFIRTVESLTVVSVAQ